MAGSGRRRGAGRGERGNHRAPLRVDCHDSPRWLEFQQRAQLDALAQDDLVVADVMTIGEDGEPHKLCELTMARGDLLRAIAAAGDPAHRTARTAR